MKAQTTADRLRICQEQRSRQATTIMELQSELVRCYDELGNRTPAPDPEAPPIPCVRVDDTDDRPTWRAMGEDVRTLGDEWEMRLQWDLDSDPFWPITGVTPGHVYLIRRTLPPAPRTVMVELPEDVVRQLWRMGDWPDSTDHILKNAAAKALGLPQDGDR